MGISSSRAYFERQKSGQKPAASISGSDTAYATRTGRILLACMGVLGTVVAYNGVDRALGLDFPQLKGSVGMHKKAKSAGITILATVGSFDKKA